MNAFKEYLAKGMEYFKANKVKTIVIAVIVLGAISAVMHGCQ